MSTFTKGIGALFSAPKLPKMPGATPLPDPGAFSTKLAARKKQDKERKKRGGRDSTIRTGGGNYSGSNLGGTA